MVSRWTESRSKITSAIFDGGDCETYVVNGYKLPRLLQQQVGVGASVQETLFGDDSEVDALVYRGTDVLAVLWESMSSREF